MARPRTKLFVINSPGVEEYLATDPELHAFMGAKVGEVVASLDNEVFAWSNDSTIRVAVPILFSVHTTDRAAGIVTLAHPAGLALEAKYGYLAQAAAAAGFSWGRKNRNPRGGA